MLKVVRHPPYQGGSPRLSAPPLSRGIPPPIGTPLIKGGLGIGTPLIKGDPPAYRHPPYQGGSPRLSAPPLSRGIPPPIGTPLIKGGRGDRS
ncbi:MAG: hypothetical protein DWQ56_00030 [Microcystis aeruginosa DA14]|uniref:Uncharacterized protein n=1 Tax=Microcystis aeruginosa DA14 TaxID=1987506 RepID=A0A3E0MIT5_MICAE|nr:MAG: hypothetical protein DWQ56_00030 [Microcystis aeruginosa DA14]